MTTFSQSDPTARLAAFLSTLEPDRIPARVLERTKDLVLDHLAGALHSLSLPWSTIVRDYAGTIGGRAQSTIYGYGRTDRLSAALANGTAAHGIELDDTHNESFSHPGAVVIPAAFAVAESQGASGLAFLTAIVAGYEAQCRAGAAAGPGLMPGGVHPTSSAGVFGATAAVARLLGLDTARTESAFGLGLSMVSGAMQFTEDGENTMVKRLHGGLPARSGIMAAELAGAGLRGPRQALEGRYGFLNVFAHKSDPARLVRGLGEQWEVDGVGLKVYACCRIFHSFIDAIREARDEQPWNLADIEGIEVSLPPMALEGRMQYQPQSVMAAQYSLPYATAATLLLDPRDPRSFSEEAMARPEVNALMKRVKGKPEPELDQYMPAKFPGAVRFTFRGGRVVERTTLDCSGTPERPLDRDGVIGKFHSLTNGVISAQAQERIVDAVIGLDAPDGVKRLGRLLLHCSERGRGAKSAAKGAKSRASGRASASPVVAKP
jgi:2-methylcitrate dehydratase PrpD